MFIKLFEQGYVPIPVNPKGKNPTISEWSKYCREKPSVELIESWEELFNNGKINIGVTCGEASGIIVLDIDTDDREMLGACPSSPVVRKGKKGEARFFRYDASIVSRAFHLLDVLSDGRQVLVPPSIHPDTKRPYAWLTEETLMDYKPHELPTLDMSFVDHFDSRLYGKDKTVGGRNNTLKSIVCSMKGRGLKEAEIISEILKTDKKLHGNNRLFLDKNDYKKSLTEEDALQNAALFFYSVSASLTRQGVIKYQDDEIILVSEDEENKTIEQYKSKSYPEPTGLIKDIRDLIVEFSERDMPNIALGGAVSLMSIVCSNRFRIHDTWTNTYVLNLAPTGAGKSFPQRIVSKILDEELGTELIGYGNYQSSSAFSKNLVSRRERLDIIDEISSLFAQMKSGGLYQTSILEEMCKVWSSSSGKFNGSEYSEKEDTASCFNPCISILGSSTIEGLKENVTKMMTTKGLLPRFLIFSHENYGALKNDSLNRPLLESVVKDVRRLLAIPKKESNLKVDITIGPLYDPINLAPVDRDAMHYLQAIKLEFAERTESEKSVPLKDMLTRGKENTMKLAALHCASNFRNHVSLADLEWAKGTFEVCLHNATPFIQETAVDSDYERDVQRLINLFQKTNFVTDALIVNRFRSLQPKRRKEIIETLLTGGKIRQATSKRGKLGYTLADAI